MFKKRLFKITTSICVILFCLLLINCNKTISKADKENFNSSIKSTKNNSNDFLYNKNSNIKNLNRSLPPNLGLGKIETEALSNDRPYPWYIEQNTTGEFSKINCVPSSVLMALKWVYKDFSKNTDDLRKDYINRFNLYEGWNSRYAAKYLREQGVKCSIYDSALSQEFLKSKLKEGSIALVAVDMQFITNNNSTEGRVGRIYGAGKSYHALIIKGYKIVDGKLYFEAYDPDGNGEKYSDGSYKGENRYYLGSELIKGILERNGDIITIDGSTYSEIPLHTDKGKIVNFKDRNVEKAVRQELGAINGTNYKDVIFEGDLDRVFNLSIINCDLKYTDDIKKLKNLDNLSLINLNLEDISFIKDLNNLTRLNLSNNKIKNISPLNNLTNINQLQLDINFIEDISPLKNLTNLRFLYLNGNNIIDFSPINSYYSSLSIKDF